MALEIFNSQLRNGAKLSGLATFIFFHKLNCYFLLFLRPLFELWMLCSLYYLSVRFRNRDLQLGYTKEILISLSGLTRPSVE